MAPGRVHSTLRPRGPGIGQDHPGSRCTDRHLRDAPTTPPLLPGAADRPPPVCVLRFWSRCFLILKIEHIGYLGVFLRTYSFPSTCCWGYSSDAFILKAVCVRALGAGRQNKRINTGFRAQCYKENTTGLCKRYTENKIEQGRLGVAWRGGSLVGWRGGCSAMTAGPNREKEVRETEI